MCVLLPPHLFSTLFFPLYETAEGLTVQRRPTGNSIKKVWSPVFPSGPFLIKSDVVVAGVVVYRKSIQPQYILSRYLSTVYIDT
jgi:hypothetical protein